MTPFSSIIFNWLRWLLFNFCSRYKEFFLIATHAFIVNLFVSEIFKLTINNWNWLSITHFLHLYTLHSVFSKYNLVTVECKLDWPRWVWFSFHYLFYSCKFSFMVAFRIFMVTHAIAFCTFFFFVVKTVARVDHVLVVNCSKERSVNGVVVSFRQSAQKCLLKCGDQKVRIPSTRLSLWTVICWWSTGKKDRKWTFGIGKREQPSHLAHLLSNLWDHLHCPFWFIDFFLCTPANNYTTLVWFTPAHKRTYFFLCTEDHSITVFPAFLMGKLCVLPVCYV